jgi:hypothetical protein
MYELRVTFIDSNNIPHVLCRSLINKDDISTIIQLLRSYHLLPQVAIKLIKPPTESFILELSNYAISTYYPDGALYFSIPVRPNDNLDTVIEKISNLLNEPKLFTQWSGMVQDIEETK